MQKDRKLFWILMFAGGSITAALVYFLGSMLFTVAFAGGKVFVLPTISMEPTLRGGERILVETQNNNLLQRGDVVVVAVQKDGRSVKYAKRLVAFGGDTVELRDGVIIINGKTVPQSKVLVEDTVDFGIKTERVTLREQFPDEETAHQIYDTRRTSGDDFGPVTVPTDHLFLLGDNRDNSADSRFPEIGIGMVPTHAVVGRVTTLYWSNDPVRIGQSVQ